jgi:hypothetical protein
VSSEWIGAEKAAAPLITTVRGQPAAISAWYRSLRARWVAGIRRLADHGQQVTELGALGAEILAVGLAREHLDGYALDDRQAVLPELPHLVGVVRHQAHLAHAQIEQDAGPGLVVPHVGGEPERVVRFDRVVAAVLQRVGPDLVEQADAAPLVEHVDQHARARLLDHRERRVELLAAIAALAAEDVSGQAL